MPKLKSHSGAKKRFKFTKNGKIKKYNANRRHKFTSKSPKRKRTLRKASYLDFTNVKSIRLLLAARR